MTRQFTVENEARFEIQVRAASPFTQCKISIPPFVIVSQFHRIIYSTLGRYEHHYKNHTLVLHHIYITFDYS